MTNVDHSGSESGLKQGIISPVFDTEEVAVPPLDPTLEQLAMIVNDSDGECGVTLHASGLMISGTMVSAGTYFRRLATVLREQSHGSMAEWAEMWAEDLTVTDEERADATLSSVPPAHIHLADVKTYLPGTPGTISQPFWRGRLSAITGWSLGVSDRR